ncbi:MAG TPA: hypothetical protein VG406_06225 [Isosphaeraceae bacterium]|jgi:hypothetical protein|nr:hypothetical protein [Isosphaeraceae bacterium]
MAGDTPRSGCTPTARDLGHDWLFRRTLQGHRARIEARRLRPGESLLTLMIAGAALGLGLVELSATFGGIAGYPMAPWNMPRHVPGRVTTVLVVTPAGMLLAATGAALGAVGIAQRGPRRRVSRLSAAGLAACYLGLIGGFAYDLVVLLLF